MPHNRSARAVPRKHTRRDRDQGQERHHPVLRQHHDTDMYAPNGDHVSVRRQRMGTGNGWGSGIQFCNLASTSSATVAVKFGVDAGDTSGRSAQGATLDNVQITGFGIQYDLESQAWNISVNHFSFLNPARYAIYTNPSAINSGENLSFAGITVADSLNTWILRAVNLTLGSVIATFISSNFDNAEVFCGAGTMNLISPYSENPGSVLRTTPWVDIGSRCVSTIVGMTAADDDTGAPATQVAVSIEGSLSFFGGTIFGQPPAKGYV